ncbi:MAG: hypothetical protein JST70_14770 [Bacteroidetes bacterium]|nr:hypothetical protein [Bacteroidota bacterium]
MNQSMTGKLIKVVFAVVLVFSSINLKAQLIKKKHIKESDVPKFVLVQLPTESRKINWFSKGSNKTLVASIKNDAAHVREAMISDFSDHFDAVPVYYYIDTNATLIKEGKFNGILLDKNMKAVTNASSMVQPYQIIIYGSRVPTTDEYNASGNNPNDGAYVIGTKKDCLVVYDKNFNKVESPAPNGDDLRWIPARKLGKKYPKYRYLGSKEDINYIPYASQLNQEMNEYYFGG